MLREEFHYCAFNLSYFVGISKLSNDNPSIIADSEVYDAEVKWREGTALVLNAWHTSHVIIKRKK